MLHYMPQEVRLVYMVLVAHMIFKEAVANMLNLELGPIAPIAT